MPQNELLVMLDELGQVARKARVIVGVVPYPLTRRNPRTVIEVGSRRST
ncbi:hypothetical protein ACQPWW_26855 [Micromonospora sp. CA-240977]